MAPSTQSTSSNGKKLSFKPQKSSSGIRPTIPPGKWLDSSMPRNGFKVTATKDEYPMLSIPIKLGRADDDSNESYQGATDTLRVIFYGDEAGDKTRAANMSKIRLRALCEAIDVDYDEVYPTSIESEDDLNDLIEALADKEIPELWTTNRTSTMASGEETVNVDFFFKEPGSSFGRGDAGGDEPGSKGKGGKSGGKGGKSRR